MIIYETWNELGYWLIMNYYSYFSSSKLRLINYSRVSLPTLTFAKDEGCKNNVELKSNSVLNRNLQDAENTDSNKFSTILE